MLVLNRKKGETIIIGENIRITVVDVQGDNVKIGIEAPRNVNILRAEIYQEVTVLNRQASQQQISPAQLQELKNLKTDQT